MREVTICVKREKRLHSAECAGKVIVGEKVLWQSKTLVSSYQYFWLSVCVSLRLPCLSLIDQPSFFNFSKSVQHNELDELNGPSNWTKQLGRVFVP